MIDELSSISDELRGMRLNSQISLFLVQGLLEVRDVMGNFGENLKLLMDHKNIRVTNLAKSIGESSKTIQEWIGSGARTPRNLECIKKLARYFDVSTHFLLFGEEDPCTYLNKILDKTEAHAEVYEVTIRKVKK